MPTLPAISLPNRIQKLLEERQQHAEAIARIDETLKGVNAALDSATNGRKTGPTPTITATSVAPTKRKTRRRVGKFAMTGEESILSFIKKNKNPTNREIEQHWKSEGRGNVAANLLSKMAKAKKLKRTSLDGQRGSRYSLL